LTHIPRREASPFNAPSQFTASQSHLEGRGEQLQNVNLRVHFSEVGLHEFVLIVVDQG
jgi:hypothetical protein